MLAYMLIKKNAIHLEFANVRVLLHDIPNINHVRLCNVKPEDPNIWFIRVAQEHCVKTLFNKLTRSMLVFQ